MADPELLARLAARAVAGAAEHHYVSTYCIHAEHADCRRTCKLCQAPCLCSCHLADQPPTDPDPDAAAAAVEAHLADTWHGHSSS